MAKSLQDSKDLLMHLVHGTALPEKLAKVKAQSGDRSAIIKAAEESLSRAPLIAMCFKHTCRCGNVWTSFGFYARKVGVDLPGQARAYPTKRLDYFPHNERVNETVWQPVEEQACINCFGGATLLIEEKH